MADDNAPDLPEIRARYGRIAAAFDSRVAALSALGWNHQTPCPDWNARDLLAHVVDTHRRVLATLDGSTPGQVGDRDDAVECWRVVATDTTAALAADESALATVKFFGGETPFATLAGGLLCADTLIHTWDLARATGQDETLDPAAVEAATTLLVGYGDGIRSPDGFGPEVPAAAGADAQTRLICYCGRAV